MYSVRYDANFNDLHEMNLGKDYLVELAQDLSQDGPTFARVLGNGAAD
jgi:hypothetical protein